jgi:tripartite-type tricarboxylate transporter receptor subunit TctC
VGNVMDYIAWVKAQPKDARYGAGGAGGQAHFAGTQLAMAAGIDLLMVPYKGNGPVSTDLMGGHLPAAILPASDLMQHRNNPKLQILGIFENQRSPLMPDVPTFAEQGLKFSAGQAWMGMWAPAKTPAAEIRRVENALRKVLGDPAFKELLSSRFSMQPMFKGSAETDQLQRAELDLWRPVIKASGFTPDK